MIDGKSILYFVWITTTLSFFFLIPKSKVRLAIVAFLFKQAMTWPMGLYVVDMGWIQYPIRLFENSNKASFTFEYFAYPVLCMYFNIYFPERKSLLIRGAYYIMFCSVITVIELLLMHFTNLIRYIHWDAYLTWITLFITFYATRLFCLWFFKPHITLAGKPKTIKSLFIRISRRR